MRKTVHLCLSSHEEVMCRNSEDLIMGFNCLALAVLETESRLLGEGFMTTHNHKLVQTDDYKELAFRERYAYSRYFNSKYKRKGRLGERAVFVLEVEGSYHTLNALNYVLRQGLHHGLSTTPFGYPHCSANSFFRKELGREHSAEEIAKEKRHCYLPQHKDLPGEYRMAKSGLIMREDIIDTAYVEQIYITPRNFLFQMNKLSDEKAVKDQMAENDSPPVTLDVIEAGVSTFDLKKALTNEIGRIDKDQLTDLKVCQIIDEKYLPRFLKAESGSIYLLSEEKRAEIGNAIWTDAGRQIGMSQKPPFFGHRPTVSQIKRCLAL